MQPRRHMLFAAMKKRGVQHRLKKPYSRLLLPGALIYFAALAALSAAAYVMKAYSLSILILVADAALLVFFLIENSRKKRDISRYIQSTTAALDTAFKGEMPMPMAIVSIASNEIFWANEQMRRVTGLHSSHASQKLDSHLPGLSLRWLAEGKSEAPQDYTLGGRRYRVIGTQVHSEETDPSLLLATIYLLDLTDLFQVRDEYIRSRPVVSIILIDNYDELIANLPDSAASIINAKIDSTLTKWVGEKGGLLRKLERNRYLYIFEEKDLPAMTEEKFQILEAIRVVTNSSGIAATISLGLGKDGASYAENYSFAALSIEMALSRGGDQAVVKDRYNFTFFGGKTKETERRTKVKSRVIANSLSELIAQSSHVFIMGHQNADLDAIGAAAGVMCICRKKNKNANIVVDMEVNAAKDLIAKLRTSPEYENAFLSSDDAMLIADPKSLLIIVDTNRPDQVQSKSLLESIPRVAVIDHHRRAADYIEHVVLNLHEPFVSSASELVAELLQYAVDTKDILPLEAEALLAGIVLDTKNFSVRTGSRTFEAAAFLRRTGADTVDVKKLFQNDLQNTLARYQIVEKARLYRGDIAISALDYTANRTIAAQASDELLNISGIQTSFVLYPDGDRVLMSARSIGETNVQVILEPLGGGGNAATAGAQISGQSVSEVLRALIASIDKYFED